MAERVTEETMARLHALQEKTICAVCKGTGDILNGTDCMACRQCCENECNFDAIRKIIDRQQAEIAALVEALKAVPCTCIKETQYYCPTCKSVLKLIPNGLNGVSDCWECPLCVYGQMDDYEGNRRWQWCTVKDYVIEAKQCSRCATLVNLSSAAEARDKRLKAESAAEALEAVAAKLDKADFKYFILDSAIKVVRDEAEAARLRRTGE